MNFLVSNSFDRAFLLIIYLFLQLNCFSVFSNEQNSTGTQSVSESIIQQNTVVFEKIYVHLDRSSYAVGEDIWFKVYLLDAESNLPLTNSQMVNVELIDSSDRIVDSRVIKVIEGGGDGEFKISPSASTGEYTVRAYTNYMRNFDTSFFFRKSIQVRSGLSQIYGDTSQPQDSISDLDENPRTEAKPDVQFFPEGGYMVADLSSRIGFKVLNENGKSISVSGYVENESGRRIAEFNTLKFGMGSFRLNPELGKTYKAFVLYNGMNYEYTLPESLSQGISMMVIQRADHYQINIQSTLPEGVLGLSFIGTQKGVMVSRAVLDTNSKNGLIRVPMSSLENGILKLSVYDKNNKPLGERLVFAELNNPLPKLSVQNEQDVYKKRGLVEINISLDVPKQQIKQANMSVAVTDMSMGSFDDCDIDIQSYLMLESELKGEIEDPCYYFDTSKPDRKRVLDLLMMTQGWRKYLWNELAAQESQKLEYSIETGISFAGTIKSIYNHKVPVSSDVSLTFKNRDLIGKTDAKTFGQGKFLFQGYQFKDSTSIIIQANKDEVKKGSKSADSNVKNKDFFIELDTFIPPKIVPRMNFYHQEDIDLSETGPEAYKRAKYLDSIYANQLDYVYLSEIELKTVSRKRERDKYLRKDMRYVQPTVRYDYELNNVIALGDDLFWSLANHVPGLRLVNGTLVYRGGSPSLTSTNGNPAGTAFLLNGVQVLGNINALVNANDVSFVDILTGPSAVMYSATTVIAVYTKSPGDRSKSNVNSGTKKGIISFIHPGFYEARAFYEPNYKSLSPEDKKADFRTTLYWKPTLKLGRNGKAKISFYTADATSTYRIEIEGISSDGYPVRNETFFDVE